MISLSHHHPNAYVAPVITTEWKMSLIIIDPSWNMYYPADPLSLPPHTTSIPSMQVQLPHHQRLAGNDGGPPPLAHPRDLGGWVPRLDLSQLDISSGLPDYSFQNAIGSQYAYGRSLSARTSNAYSYTSRGSPSYQANSMYTPRQGAHSARGPSSRTTYGRQYNVRHLQCWMPDGGGQSVGLEEEEAFFVPSPSKTADGSSRRIAAASHPSKGMRSLKQDSWLSGRGVNREEDPYEDFFLHSPRSHTNPLWEQ